MRAVMVLVTTGLALAGCAGPSAVQPVAAVAAAPVDDATALADAQRVVARKLRDPESARFAEVERRAKNMRGEAADIVCGRVNAKNAFGGYVGQRPFVYFVDRRDAVLAEGDIEKLVVRANCVGWTEPLL